VSDGVWRVPDGVSVLKLVVTGGGGCNDRAGPESLLALESDCARLGLREGNKLLGRGAKSDVL